MPSLISHDTHRPTGWTLPTVLSIEPGLTRLHGRTFMPDSDAEKKELDERYQAHLAARVAEETREHLADLRGLLAPHLEGDEIPMAPAATALVAPDLARRVAARVFGSEDKDGLVDLRGLVVFQPGIYRLGDLVLFAHPFFRRSFSRWNNLNESVLSALDGVAQTGRGSVRIRLDPDMVGLAASVHRPIELDYWYGPRFDDNLASIPTGVTRHEASEREKYFFAISATEFWWHSRDGQHSLEAEELRELPTIGAGREVFGCRYVHSIVEEASGRIVHLDGAIRAYSEDKMIARLGVPITTAGRRSDYTKLWRVDGDIPLATWKSLIHGHYRDNPLVAEYLQGEQHPESNAERPESGPPQQEPSPIAALVPHSVSPGRSARLLLSFHDLPALAPDDAPAVVPLEDLVADDRTQTVVDADVSELQKALRRGGGDLKVPEGAMRLAFEDFYLTFPLVRHASAQQVTATVAALEAILRAWARSNNDDRVVAFSLGAPLGDLELRISVFGHVRDLGACLPLVRDLFACTDQEAVANWVDRAVTVIGANGADEAVGSFDRLITPSGTYRMMRTILQPETFRLMEVQGQLKFELALPNEKPALVLAVNTGALRPIFARLIRASTCSRCGGDYIACDCSKYLDTGVGQRCGDFEIAYVFWTDRPA